MVAPALCAIRDAALGCTCESSRRGSIISLNPLNFPAMNTQDLSAAIGRIESGMERLMQRVEALERENRSLMARQESLVAERAGLVQRNEEARSRVESMIERLKSLENAS